MPKRTTKYQTLPENLKPYDFHGIDVYGWNGRSKDVSADCPFCEREGKFNIVVASGVSRCVVCNAGSEKGGLNAVSFVRQLWEMFSDTNDLNRLAKLSQERKISVDTLMLWGVCWSSLTSNWVIPAFNSEGKMCQLYSWRETEKGKVLFPTPTLGSHLFGVGCYNKESTNTYLTEGPWDGMALFDAFQKAGWNKKGDSLIAVDSLEKSLASDSGVLSVPGAGTFNPQWSDLFGDHLFVMYDNDYEKTNEKTGQIVPPAGINGVKRVVAMVSGSPNQPKSMSYLRWGEQGWTENYPHGTDVRDILNASKG